MKEVETSKLKIAIAGCGGIAAHYEDVYRQLDWVEVTVCLDTNLAVAEKTAQKFPNSVATSDFQAVLSDNVDVVILNTPNHLHLEQSAKIFAAGKHLLLQKPVAQNLTEAAEIGILADMAAQKGVISGLYLSYFDQPLMHDFRQMIEENWFGEIVHLFARLMHRGGMEWSEQVLNGAKNWRGSIEQTGGGCFIQLAVHHIHIFRWLMQMPVVSVTAVTKNLHCPGLEGEDLACAILEFENGALATIETAWCSGGELTSIHGTRGSADYVNNRMLMLSTSAGNFGGRIIKYFPPTDFIFATPGAAYAVQMQEIFAPRLDDALNPLNQQRVFLEAVRDKKQPFVSIKDGVEDMRVVAAIYESAKTGRKVEINQELKEIVHR
jgi:UDP-N-acetyl-2-amino-2-deoxyglucuronate dehydrogenase